MPRLLIRRADARVRLRRPGRKLLDREYVRYARSSKRDSIAAGAEGRQGTLCCRRRGGASQDRSMGAKSFASARHQGGRRGPRSLGREKLRGELGRKPQKVGQAGPQLSRDAAGGIARAFERYFAQPPRPQRAGRHT